MSGPTIQGIHQERGGGLHAIDWAFQPDGENLTKEVTAGKTTVHRFAGNQYLGTQDPAGNFASQTQDNQFRPAAQIDANGHQTSLVWSSDGKQLQQVTDALGNLTAFTYNVGGASNGTLASSTDAQGRQTVYTYSDGSNPRLPTRVQVYDNDGLTILLWQEFSYDSVGRTLTEKTFDPASNGTTLLQETDRTYYTSGSGNGLLQKVTQLDLQNAANNVTTTYFYDSVGRVIRSNQSATFGNCTSSFTLYDAAGNVLASVCNYDPGLNTDPTTLAQVLSLFSPLYPDRNKITTYAYDSLGRRVQVTTDAGAPYAQTTLTVYDSLNRVVRSIANYVPSVGIADPYAHKRADFPHGDLNDQNLITETTYNERGLVRSQTDVLGNVALFGYDDAGRLVKTIQSASQPTYDNSYGLMGDPTLSHYVANAAPDQDLISISVYDPAGNLVASTDALGNASFTVYDALNRPVKTVRSASVPTYNVLADPTLSDYPFNNAADVDLLDVTEYDAMGRVRRSQDVMGAWTLFGYDGLGRLVKTIRSASNPNYDLTADPALANYPASASADQDIIAQTAFDNAGRVHRRCVEPQDMDRLRRPGPRRAHGGKRRGDGDRPGRQRSTQRGL
jgi:YD repeat-containing protein